MKEVNWGKIQHAYGDAKDVPGQLRDLASRDREKGDKALYAFYGNIHHQGTTYEATRYAVPFLRQILGDKQSPFRTEILQLLVHLAFGHSYHDVHQDMVFFDQKRDEPEFQATIARELDDVQLAHDAVSEGAAQYLALLSDESADVRAGALYLAALFGNQHLEVAPAIWRHLESETDTAVRATAWMGLNFGALESEEVARLEAAFREIAPGLEKWAISAALSRHGKGEIRELAAREMIAALDEPEYLSNYDELPFNGEGLAADSMAQLLNLGTEARRFAAPLCDKLRCAANQYQANGLWESLGPLFFGDFSQENPVLWHRLDGDQREVVRALAETDAIWGDGKTIFVNFSSTLSYFGLPSDRAGLRNLISN